MTTLTPSTEEERAALTRDGDEARNHIRPLEMDLESSAPPSKSVEKSARREAYKLIFGAGGIYLAFLYYGSLQEDVFRFEADDGSTFQFAWFLQVLEAFANIIVGYFGRRIAGGTPGLPMKPFAITGTSQVFAKALTSLALAKGLSFPVATLAKSGKMAPVMAGQLLLGGASYSIRDYLQVVAIIGGTAILSLGKKKGGQNSTLGLVCIILSLVADGVTGGYQKKLKADMGQKGISPKPYDFMYFTNMYMCLVALVISICLGEIVSGTKFCISNPAVMWLVIQFSICSAVGQSFIFFTVAHFDPLVCSTVTTTRKIFSVLLSIFTKGHVMTMQGWVGVSIACGGILSEVQAKISKSRQLKSKVSM